MTHALVWMPTLDVRQSGEQFFDWNAQRFLKRHGGFGHIIARKKGPWPSLETLDPVPDHVWYRAQTPPSPEKSHTAGVTLEMTLSSDANFDPVNIVSSQANKESLSRIILKRGPGVALASVVSTLWLCLETAAVPIWLDIHSFGWDGASYLAALNPLLQIAGVTDNDVHLLAKLAGLLERPLLLADLSPRSPKPLLPLPGYADDPDLVHVLKTLPYWNHSR